MEFGNRGADASRMADATPITVHVGVENIYCCRDSTYVGYTMTLLDAAMLEELREFEDSKDLYDDYGASFQALMKSSHPLTCEEYNQCDFKLQCTHC